MTLKNNFSIILGFFPYNSKNKGERQKWISDSDSTSKNTLIKRKKTSFSYMTLNDNNTKNLNLNACWSAQMPPPPHLHEPNATIILKNCS